MMSARSLATPDAEGMRMSLLTRVAVLTLTAGLLAPGARLRAAEFDPKGVDAIVEASLKAWEIPGAALVIVRDDKVLHMRGFGVRDIEGRKPVTPDTLFAIASCTKAFTATTIGTLVDDGKMAWDDPVRKHLPTFRLNDPLADANVTIRDLLSHRTGVDRHDLIGHGAPWGRAEVLRRVAFLPAKYSFRSHFQYNNIMYVAAGEASGRAHGGTWEQTVQKRLLEPLGMKQVNFSVKDAEAIADHARPHVPRSGKVKLIPWHNIDNMGPAGSMNAGVRELVPWLRLQLGDGELDGKRVVSAASLAETHLPQMIVRLQGEEKELNPESLQKSYGLGWFIQDYRGKHLLSHTGGLDGFRCRIALLPKERLAIALLTNSSAGLSRASMPIACVNSLIDHLLGLSSKHWDAFYLARVAKAESRRKELERKRIDSQHKGTKPSRELAAYAGEFEEPAYGQARISLESDRLRIAWSSFNNPLEHFHFDTFVVKGDSFIEDEEVVFHLDGDGAVASFEFLGVTFKRARR
jgi:CubicO group peptidase (beta-lactamase class C family)